MVRFALIALLLTAAIHGAAHVALGMQPGMLETVGIALIYYALPLTALWSARWRQPLAALVFAAGFVHGTLRHFVFPGDCAPSGSQWGTVFFTTAVALSVVSVAGLAALALRPSLHYLIRRGERKIGVDSAYAHDIVDTSLPAFAVFSAFLPLAGFRQSLPKACWFAARILATRHADCGTCLQMVINEAHAENIDPALVRGILAESDLPDDIRDVVDFTQHILRHTYQEAEVRQKIRERFGERALIDLAFAIASSQVFPTIKKVLGHGVSCAAVKI